MNQAQAGEMAPTFIAAFTLVTLPIVEGLIPVSHAIERIPTYHESLETTRLDRNSLFHKSSCMKSVVTAPISSKSDVSLNEGCLLSL